MIIISGVKREYVFIILKHVVKVCHHFDMFLHCRNYSPQVRSKDQIQSTPGVYERDQFAPKPQTKFGKALALIVTQTIKIPIAHF